MVLMLGLNFYSVNAGEIIGLKFYWGNVVKILISGRFYIIYVGIWLGPWEINAKCGKVMDYKIFNPLTPIDS